MASRVEARAHLLRRWRASAGRNPIPQERRLSGAALGQGLATMARRSRQVRLHGTNLGGSNRVKPAGIEGGRGERCRRNDGSSTKSITSALFARFCGYSVGLAGIKAYQSKSNQIKPLGRKWQGVSGEWLVCQAHDGTPSCFVAGHLASLGTRRRSSLPKIGGGKWHRQPLSGSVKPSQTNLLRFEPYITKSGEIVMFRPAGRNLGWRRPTA